MCCFSKSALLSSGLSTDSPMVGDGPPPHTKQLHKLTSKDCVTIGTQLDARTLKKYLQALEPNRAQTYPLQQSTTSIHNLNKIWQAATTHRNTTKLLSDLGSRYFSKFVSYRTQNHLHELQKELTDNSRAGKTLRRYLLDSSMKPSVQRLLFSALTEQKRFKLFKLYNAMPPRACFWMGEPRECMLQSLSLPQIIDLLSHRPPSRHAVVNRTLFQAIACSLKSSRLKALVKDATPEEFLQLGRLLTTDGDRNLPTLLTIERFVQHTHGLLLALARLSHRRHHELVEHCLTSPTEDLGALEYTRDAFTLLLGLQCNIETVSRVIQITFMVLLAGWAIRSPDCSLPRTQFILGLLARVLTPENVLSLAQLVFQKQCLLPAGKIKTQLNEGFYRYFLRPKVHAIFQEAKRARKNQQKAARRLFSTYGKDNTAAPTRHGSKPLENTRLQFVELQTQCQSGVHSQNAIREHTISLKTLATKQLTQLRKDLTFARNVGESEKTFHYLHELSRQKTSFTPDSALHLKRLSLCTNQIMKQMRDWLQLRTELNALKVAPQPTTEHLWLASLSSAYKKLSGSPGQASQDPHSDVKQDVYWRYRLTWPILVERYSSLPNQAQFRTEIYRAVWQELSQRLGEDARELDIDELTQQVIAFELNSDLTESKITIRLQDSELGQFTTARSYEQRARIVQQAQHHSTRSN